MRRARSIQVGALALLLVAALFVLVACGGDEPADTTSTAGVATTAEVTTTMTTPSTTASTFPQAGMFGPVEIELTGEEVVPPVETDARGIFRLEMGTGESAGGGATTTDGTGTGTDGVTSTSDDDDDNGSATVPGATGTTGVGTGTTGAGAFGALQWTLELEGIENVTAAHIHLGQAGENGPIIVPLFTGPPREGAFDGVLAEGTFTMADLQVPDGMTEAQAFMALQAGGAYVAVHTTQNPAAELRGQLEFGAGAAGGTPTTGGTGMMGGAGGTTSTMMGGATTSS